jgi:hypothetical protein
MAATWNVRDFAVLLSEYREEFKHCRDLGKMRRYKCCIAELEMEIAKRKAKAKKRLLRREIA